MKELRFWGCFTAMALMLSGCGDDSLVKSGSAQGQLALDVSVNSQVISSTTVTGSRAADGGVEAWEVTRDDLSMIVTASDGAAWYFNLGTFDESTEFPVGTYSIKVYYGDADAEGFGNPYYYGEATNVVVSANQVTPVTIKAELNNSMFMVTYSDNVKNYLDDYSVDFKSETGTEDINYPADATRRVYMKPENVAVTFNITKQGGEKSSVLVATVPSEIRKFYNIKADITGDFDKTNGASLVVTFNDDLEEGETVTINLDDEALATPAPTITTEGFTSGVAINHIEGAIYSEDLLATIYAPGKLSQVNLVTDNAERISGWPASIDLLAATAAEQANLKALGLSAVGLWRNPDEMAEINFKGVLEHIALLTQTSTADVTFTLTVVDANGKSSDPTVLTTTVEPFVAELSISDPSTTTLALGESSLTMTVGYNGSYIADNVKIQYNDVLGVWNDATVSYEAVTGQENTYTATVSGLPETGDLELRAIYTDGTTSNEIAITRTYPDIKLSISENDVWCYEATFTVLAADGSSVLSYGASTLGVQLSTNGTSYTTYTKRTVDGDQVTLTGLSANTTYYVKVTLSGDDADLSDAISFTTEEDRALPNHDMSSWSYEQPTTKYQLVWYPYANTSAAASIGDDTEQAWGTMNLLTTSESGTGNSMFSYGGTSYRAFSGTRAAMETTEDPNTGEGEESYSGATAIIQTVGWGSGNTSFGNSGACQNVTAGQLYLGSYDSSSQSPVYGYAFASRPQSMTFYYKYIPTNSADYGYAEISVLDANDNVLATATKQITAQDSYIPMTLNLSYAAGCAKAAKIKVIFKSSDNATCLQWDKSSNYLHNAGTANWTDGRYTGSSLYVDETTLSYK
ncbi:MAG: DUF4493 domain-containing protein [Bacteroidales bacterium]|nr:DUF4493 domain-containing protein [Bacteroidales bacterium]